MIADTHGFHTHLGFLVLSLLAGLIAAGSVAVIDALLRRHDRHDPDEMVQGQYDELPGLERRILGERRTAPERRWTERRGDAARRKQEG